MGWSCAAAASMRLSAIADWTYTHGGAGSQNVWVDPKDGQKYFFETSSREHRDGAITGAVHRFVDEDCCIKVGSFRISPDGREFRGPAILKRVQAYEVMIDGQSHREWEISRLGEPTDENLWTYVLGYARSFESGGLNARVSQGLGYVPYPTRAEIVCINDGRTVATWKAAAFQVWSA